jgi:8-oxo-dGTP pyrophosphatase MutT (NUDIX family)
MARPGADGVEVLVLRRGRANRFGPGFVVFPGGSIDPEDADLADRWFGSSEDAPRACAVRELAEEASIVVTANGPRLLRLDEDALAEISTEPPEVEALPQISRWIAPEFLEVRFDARFFAARAPAGLEARADGVETESAWWATPRSVLDHHDLGESLMWPTYNMLKELTGCTTVDDVMGLRAEQVPPPIQRP